MLKQRRLVAFFGLMLIVLVTLSGCATTIAQNEDSPESSMAERFRGDTQAKLSKMDVAEDATVGSMQMANKIGMIDTTLGSYGTGRENRLILVTMENEVHRQLLAGIPMSASNPDESTLPDGFAKFLSSLRQRYGLTRVADWPLDSLGIRCLVFEIDGSRSMQSILPGLKREKEVDTAQPVQLFTNRSSSYNDPFLPLQHGFQTLRANQSHQWSTGKGVSVAVIDTGVDKTHPDIKHSIKSTKNFVDKDDDQFKADNHGTGVVGIISAAANNATGMVGIAPDAEVFALKACWGSNRGTGAECNSFTLAKALNTANLSEVDVINLSLAGPRDPLLERLIDTAVSQGAIVIGARDPSNRQYFPAAVNNVIAAGLPNERSMPTIHAPGVKVISTAPGAEYDFYTGSSFSTAHLSGLVALLKQLEPDLTTMEVRSLLARSIDSGSETVNVCLAVVNLINADKSMCIEKVPDQEIN